jgi:type 1 fimbriae regulatory protein FimB
MPRKASYRDEIKDYLTPEEMKCLLTSAKQGRHAIRDYALFLITYRHGLRATELCRLLLTDADIERGKLHLHRLKNGYSSAHPLQPDEIRALRRYIATRTDNSPYLFVSERKGPLCRHALTYLLNAVAKRCGLEHLHPHMLRHSCGYALANKGHDLRLIQDWLGHRDIQSTVRYTKINTERYNELWR